jgi:hypothetical protein
MMSSASRDQRSITPDSASTSATRTQRATSRSAAAATFREDRAEPTPVREGSAMTYFPDLSPCRYFNGLWSDRLIAIGWLEPGNEYQKGDVSKDFLNALVTLLKAPWEPLMALGYHRCSFCRLKEEFSIYKDHELPLGARNVYIIGNDQVYIAPSLIEHYIESHEYQPPLEFQKAVMLAARTRKKDYEKKLKKIFEDQIPIKQPNLQVD